ncbi:MAG: hypothetical protein P8R42_05080 [Candidatus Binatia bacterium]|nr:hypothetical protein [Candidatus Binatia bacterium]
MSPKNRSETVLRKVGTVRGSGVASPGCEPTYAIAAAQCTGPWTMRGNEFLDGKYATSIQPDAGGFFCRD